MRKFQTLSTAGYLPLILSVLFIGTSGPLGRLIHITPVAIICLRSLIGFLLLCLLLKLQGTPIIIKDAKKRMFILGSGVLLAAHWVAYFYALKLSSVALAMLSMFTYPVITVLLEPFYLKKPFHFIQVPFALIALAGIYIIIPDLDFRNTSTLGIIVGVGSAFLFAARNLIIKKHAVGVNKLVLISYQLAVAVLVTLPFLFFVPYSWPVINNDWFYLLFLGFITTAMGHTFYVKSLNNFTVSTVSLLSNFTPVVGIILGTIFLKEKLTIDILFGGTLIILTAVAEVWLSQRQRTSKQ